MHGIGIYKCNPGTQNTMPCVAPFSGVDVLTFLRVMTLFFGPMTQPFNIRKSLFTIP